MKNRPIRVGFDLDGVLLYNPARIIRPLVSTFKKVFLKKKKVRFYVPTKSYEQLIWKVFHKSSLFFANGIYKIEDLKNDGKIVPCIITARYSFLKAGLEASLRKIRAREVYASVDYNKHDEQPHLYKEALISKYNLDVFVEDNYDIVKHLSNKIPNCEVIWIYNILDSKIQYEPKFPSLHSALDYIISKYKL